ncbi:MAG TPA: polyphosphate:AMP phosphotransferase [Verrucomicrobiae bacterium]|nr:polyphosphate:AMP phosphotransferase [Verrucomicrobiae bacterium]
MFESAEVGHVVGELEFERAAEKLHAELLAVQRQLREAKIPVVVIVSGVEAAGKSQVVKRLTQWLDARSVQSVAFWDESDEERERPAQWRYWRRLPPRGHIGIFFGSWYTRPIVARVKKKLGRGAFERELASIATLERMLTDDGALLVKLWFHVSRKEQKRRLKQIASEQRRQLTPFEKAYAKGYERFAKVSAHALRATDSGAAPWHIVDASDRRYRELTAGRILLDALRQRLAAGAKAPPQGKRAESRPGRFKTVLDGVDLRARAAPAKYQDQLEDLQSRLDTLAWRARRKKVSTVLALEGWDAAGKGGAIRRVTAALDARLFRVIPIAAPTDEERAQHYLWRFWRQLPRGGYVTIYDRSWYGRVLVERVEGFARPDEWGRAYAEINEFERQLTSSGAVLCKFWLHIGRAEQLRRFEERAATEHKKHKITDEDWRNREKWKPYARAVDEMVARTSTEYAPWTLVPANDKKHARLTVLRTVCKALERAL